MSVLEVSHLSHSYGGREIFEDVSFRLLKGEHVALVGANGEGKSTFMSIITGKLTPDAGTVTWAKRCARLLTILCSSSRRCLRPTTRWARQRQRKWTNS